MPFLMYIYASTDMYIDVHISVHICGWHYIQLSPAQGRLGWYRTLTRLAILGTHVEIDRLEGKAAGKPWVFTTHHGACCRFSQPIRC